MMKKILFFAAVALMMAGCAKDENELTTVKIGAETDLGGSTKALWEPPISDNNGRTEIVVKFELHEHVDIFEQYFPNEFRDFENLEVDNLQSAVFSGRWHGNSRGRWAAILPAGNGSVTFASSSNEYTVTLPNEQKTRARTVGISTSAGTDSIDVVTPDSMANIMIGAKNSHQNTSCFLSPLCTYLLFSTNTSISTVKVSATSVTAKDSTVNGWSQHTGCMAGKIKVTTTNTGSTPNGEWQSWRNFQKCPRATAPQSGYTYNSVTIIGKPVSRTINNTETTVNEYVVCMYPGIYQDLTLSYTDDNGVEQTLARASGNHNCEIARMYKLGYIATSK